MVTHRTKKLLTTSSYTKYRQGFLPSLPYRQFNLDNGCGDTTFLLAIVTIQNNFNNFSDFNTDTGHVL